MHTAHTSHTDRQVSHLLDEANAASNLDARVPTPVVEEFDHLPIALPRRHCVRDMLVCRHGPTIRHFFGAIKRMTTDGRSLGYVLT